MYIQVFHDAIIYIESMHDICSLSPHPHPQHVYNISIEYMGWETGCCYVWIQFNYACMQYGVLPTALRMNVHQHIVGCMGQRKLDAVYM